MPTKLECVDDLLSVMSHRFCVVAFLQPVPDGSYGNSRCFHFGVTCEHRHIGTLDWPIIFANVIQNVISDYLSVIIGE